MTTTKYNKSEKDETFQNMLSGVFEIKCPYSIDGELLIKSSIPEIVKKYGKKFLMEEINGQLKLRKTSRYFSKFKGKWPF